MEQSAFDALVSSARQAICLQEDFPLSARHGEAVDI